jgi:hypothetical protein
MRRDLTSFEAMVALLLFNGPRNRFLVSVAQTIAATGDRSTAPTLEAGREKDSGPYTFVHNL